MKIGVSKRCAVIWNAIAAEMIASGATIMDTPDGFKCVLAGSDAETERASTVGRIFYSFLYENQVFHLSFD